MIKKTQPIGKLTISTTVGFGSTWLTPRINKFTDQYPDMEISLLMSDEEIDLSTRLADIGDCERKKQFDQKFIDLARAIYIKNDRRSEIKLEINTKFGSELVEVKSYEKY